MARPRKTLTPEQVKLEPELELDIEILDFDSNELTLLLDPEQIDFTALQENPAAYSRSKVDSDDLADEAERKGRLKRKKAESRLTKFKSSKFAQIASFEEIGLPNVGEIITAITTGSFNAYTIILFAIREFGKIDKLAVTTFNMHQSVISDLFDRVDSGEIEKMDIILSESVKFRMPNRYTQMQDLFNKHKSTGKVRVKYNWNHSKILLMRIGEVKYVITGSGNLSDNAQFEQYHLSCNPQEFDFFDNWIEREFAAENRKREKIL